MTKGLYQCGGTGACILVKTDVYKSGVNYSPIYNISFWGEDRAFSIRAACAGYKLYIDTHYPCIHLYNDKIVNSICPKCLTRYTSIGCLCDTDGKKHTLKECSEMLKKVRYE
jgi:hypothetical protein